MTDEAFIRQFRCESRAKGANKRFADNINKYDVLFALKLNNFNCFYCNEKINYQKWELDHFYPKAMGGLNNKNNLVACCKWCNTMKNALDGNAFINKCRQIIGNNYFFINRIGDNSKDKINSVKLKKIKKKFKKYNISEEDFILLKNILNDFI